MTDLAELLARVESASGEETYRVLIAVYKTFIPEGDKLGYRFFQLLQCGGFVDAALALCERVLPGWWWKVGTCSVSDDACVAPDFNSPEHGDRLRAEIGFIEPRSEFDTGFDVDRRPPGNVALALCEAILRAKTAVAARGQS